MSKMGGAGKAGKAGETLDRLAAIVRARRNAGPSDSYVARLHQEGLNRILQKVGEEATETILAAKDGDKAQLVRETADLWFHLLVMLDHLDTGMAEVLAELDGRLGVSGLKEKAARNQAQTD